MNHPPNHPPTTSRRSIIKDVRTRTLAAAGILTVMLAGCSSSQTPTTASSSAAVADPTTPAASAPQSASSTPSQTPTSAAPTTPPALTDPLAAAAARIGCTGWALGSDIAPGVDSWGTCSWQAHKVQLYLITSDANFKAFTDAMSAYGVTAAHLARSGDVVGAIDDQTMEAAFKAALAG